MRIASIVTVIVLAGFGAASAAAQETAIPTKRPDVGAPAAEESAPPEPPVIHRTACPALLAGRFEGKLATPLADGACGADSPVEMTAVGKVKLPGRPLARCTMATEFAAIVETAGELSREVLGTELQKISTGPGYDCRHRNGADSGKLSEHAYANAIDIVAFEFADGRKITIEKDWPHLPKPPEDGSAEEGSNGAQNDDAPKPEPPAKRASTLEAKFLAGLHEAACKRLTTVLGPDANADHHAHFHFDLGCHGRDCTYLICE